MNTKFFEPRIVYNSHELIGVLTATFSTIDFALLESDMFFILMSSEVISKSSINQAYFSEIRYR